MTATKTCNMCHQTLPLNAFYLRRAYGEERQSACINCQRDYKKPRNRIRDRARRLVGEQVYRAMNSEERRRTRLRAADVLLFEEPNLRCTDGQIYMMANPVYPDWYKIGKASDGQSRVNSYNTGDPHRKYKMIACSGVVKNAFDREQNMHMVAEGVCIERKNEWFRLTAQDAADVASEIRWLNK